MICGQKFVAIDRALCGKGEMVIWAQAKEKPNARKDPDKHLPAEDEECDDGDAVDKIRLKVCKKT